MSPYRNQVENPKDCQTGSDVTMDELWDIVFQHLHFSALASIRMVVATRQLWVAKKHDAAYWQHMETILPHHSHYEAFRAMNKHMGLRRRVLAWASYCDGGCNSCKTSLFGICTATFPLRMKLCYQCKQHNVISEWELSRYVPHALLLALRSDLRYCWIAFPSGERVRHYKRKEVHKLLNSALNASLASLAEASRRP